MPVGFSTAVRVINPPPSPRNSPRISVTLRPPRTRQSGRDSRSPKTHTSGRKRKTKVKNAKKSKRGSQKKRGRRASKRQRGGEASTPKCRTALFGCGLKTKLTDTQPLNNPAESLSKPYYEYKNGKKELNNIINQFVDDFKNIVNRKDEYNGQNFNIEDTSIIKEGENLKDYLSRKLEVAKNKNETFSAFIDFLMKGSMGIFLCKQLKKKE